MTRSICQVVSATVAALLLAAGGAYAQTATIGGHIYTGAKTIFGPVMAPEAAALNGAKVMVQKQDSGGEFVTYGTVTGNEWTAVVPAPGDYVVMFSAPDHDCTSREFTVQDGDNQSKEAYLPPLPLPRANLLVYTFYDNHVNGEYDDSEDAPLNGVTVKAWDEHGNLLATGITGTQVAIVTPGGRLIKSRYVAEGPGRVETDGYYYFTDLPPGEIYVTSDASTAYLYDIDGPSPLPVSNPVNLAPLDFDETTEFYLLSSEEGSRAFEVALYPGDPGTEGKDYLVWHGFVEKLGQITPTNLAERFPPGVTLDEAGSITGKLADADQGYQVEFVDPQDPEPPEEPEALVPALHPGVSANTMVPDGLVILHADLENEHESLPVATAEPDPITHEFTFTNVPPGKYKLFCADVPIDYVYVQYQVDVEPNEDVIVPDPAMILETPGIMVPRFFARVQGYVKDSSTGNPIPGAVVNLRYKDGSVWQTQTADGSGWYNFDDVSEVEVITYVDVTLPAGYRGAMVTETFYPDAVWLDPHCDPTDPPNNPACVDLGLPYSVTHNAMNRYIQSFTANYHADLLLEPIPASTGDIGGFVFYDHLETGTWVGDGVYEPGEDRTMHGVTVELWDAEGTSLVATTTTGELDEAAVLAQGWKKPHTFPLDEWGGVFVGPLPGFYEFRDQEPGDYLVKVIVPAGFSPSPAGSDVAALTVAGGARNDVDFGINTLVPPAGKIEGGVFDDLFIDPRPLSLLYMEKAGIDGAPVGAYDHLGYYLGAGYQGNPMCYEGADVGPDVLTQCPPDQPLGQSPEMERRFAPTTLLYLGNDPSLPGHDDEFMPLTIPYAMGQGMHKFEADWSLIPITFSTLPDQMLFPPNEDPLPLPIIHTVTPVGSYTITGENFGSERGFSTVTLSGRELYVTAWSDTEIHVDDPVDGISGPLIVTTLAGPSNAVPLEIAYDAERVTYMAERSVFVDASNAGAGDGSQANPFATIREAIANLPAARPRYVFVKPGYYNERVQLTESDIQIIGAGPQETIVDGLGAHQMSVEGYDEYVNTGPVFFIGRGGEFGSVENIMISGLTVTGGSVEDDIGCGIFGDYGNRNLDINNCILDHNGGYYGGAIWLHKSNHDVKIWSNTISNNGNPGGYSGGISVNDEPGYGPYHGEPEHVVDDEIPGCPPGTYEIFNNHLFHNFSPDYGGAIALYEVKDHLIVAGNLIEQNHADDHGGGVFFEDSGPIDLYANTIRHNSNYDDGGAVSFEDVTDNNSTVRMHNNLVAENWADDHGENHVRGGGIAFDDTFYAELTYNTVVNNVAAGSKDPVGGGIDTERHGHEYNGSEPLGRDFPPGFNDVKIYHNIIWDNMRLEYDQKPHSDEEDLDWRFGINHTWLPDNLHVDDPYAQPESESYLNSEAFSEIENNCIDNGEYADRPGNVGVDPQFVDPDDLDWRLAPGSPVGHMGAYANGGGLPNPVGTISPLVAPEPFCNTVCFSINEVTLDTSTSEVTVRGTFGSLLSFDRRKDEVRFSILDGSGHTADVRIPPGSFRKDRNRKHRKGRTRRLRYRGPVPGKNLEVDAVFQGCSFRITTTRVQSISRPIGDKMQVSLSAGTELGREAFKLVEANGQIQYLRESSFECCPIQPIDFDHEEHLEEDEANLTCQHCHTDLATGTFSGFPGKETCFVCHLGSGGDGDDDCDERDGDRHDDDDDRDGCERDDDHDDEEGRDDSLEGVYSPPADHTDSEDGFRHRPGKKYPFSNGCTACHGPDLTGGVAPSCFTCHGKKWKESDPGTTTTTTIGTSSTTTTSIQPPQPGDGSQLYADNCSSCHGPGDSSRKACADVSRINNAIANNFGGMGSLSTVLSATDIQAVADFLTADASCSQPPQPGDIPPVDAPRLDELDPFINNDLEIPWVQMAILRPGIPFSHNRHVVDGRIDCLACHPDQPSLSHPPSVVYRVMTMRQCRVCHMEYGARNDCGACHPGF